MSKRTQILIVVLAAGVGAGIGALVAASSQAGNREVEAAIGSARGDRLDVASGGVTVVEKNGFEDQDATDLFSPTRTSDRLPRR